MNGIGRRVWIIFFLFLSFKSNKKRKKIKRSSYALCLEAIGDDKSFFCSIIKNVNKLIIVKGTMRKCRSKTDLNRFESKVCLCTSSRTKHFAEREIEYNNVIFI